MNLHKASHRHAQNGAARCPNRSAALYAFLLVVAPAGSFAQRGGGGGGVPGAGANTPIASLKTAAPPAPAVDRYVKDPAALIALGKTLFWDMQAGSDGRTACATCHFHAGADHRIQNQISGPGATVNNVLSAQDFPFRLFSNTGNNRTTLVRDSRFAAGSMGVVERAFAGIETGAEVDRFAVTAFVSPFQANGIHTRQVTGRNSPSVINAVFNVRNFWDGRASRIFNGATPAGDADGTLNAWVYRNGSIEQEPVRIENASLASQAVGPVLNSVEMSWAGRDWPELGRKLLNLAPLGRQKVAADDSVLGGMANPEGNGLLPQFSYAAMIQAAFRAEYWSAPASDSGPLQMERNFALFWGLAIQAYETTLAANDSRVDQFLEGRTDALSALEQQGLTEFRTGGSQCTTCHNGPELSAAGFTNFLRRNGVTNSDADAGFFRLGVTPADSDPGTFKTPGLRNVEFTGPYFHDGSQATLNQVLDFYGRNGDFPGGTALGNVRLGAGDRNAIVAFLRALSDDRVRYQRAPFDHPSLCVPNGHAETSPGQLALDGNQTGSVALDKWALVPETGRGGAGVPLQTFEELLNGVGNDGSRANTMNLACAP